MQDGFEKTGSIMKLNITIGNRTIGPGNPVWIIAELSANHNQDFNQAVQLIKAAKEAGADAVKLQTYTPDTMTIDCDSKYFRIGKGTVWEGMNFIKRHIHRGNGNRN
jgi:pseudaminic acid synthase